MLVLRMPECLMLFSATLLPGIIVVGLLMLACELRDEKGAVAWGRLLACQPSKYSTPSRTAVTAPCISCTKNYFCRQEKNQGTKSIAFLIHLLIPLMKSSEIFQPMHLLWATEGSWNEGLQVTARNEQISRVQSTFPSL